MRLLNNGGAGSPTAYYVVLRPLLMCSCGLGRPSMSVCIFKQHCRAQLYERESFCMALDPVLITDTRGWIERAVNDLRGAQIDLAASPPLVEDALFHCQQATEKLLKAFLTFHNQPFR